MAESAIGHCKPTGDYSIAEAIIDLRNWATCSNAVNKESLHRIADALQLAIAAQPTGASAWIEHHKGGDNLNWDRVDHPYAKATPLFTAQPNWREPLEALCDNAHDESASIPISIIRALIDKLAAQQKGEG